MSGAQTYDEEAEYIRKAVENGCDGAQREQLAEEIAAYTKKRSAVPLSSGTAAMHLAVKLAAEKQYGSASGISTPDGLGKEGSLYKRRVFVSDFAPMSLAGPVLYEGGEPIFVDCGDGDWGMDPEVLRIAFEKYTDVKIVIANDAYGYPGRLSKIRKICNEHGAILIMDASESLGAEALFPYQERSLPLPTPMFADYAVLDFGKGRIISGDGGGVLLSDDPYSARKAEYWAEGAYADAPWAQHSELGYDYRMGDLTAAMIRGQLSHVGEIIEKKKKIYERYREKLDGELAYMIPVGEDARPNYWMSAMTCESSIVFEETRDSRNYTYRDTHGTAAPMEIIEALQAFGAEALPLYKPLSMQPIFVNHEHVTLDGFRRTYEDFYCDNFSLKCHRAKQYFQSGVCLLGDIGMTEEEQDKVMEIVLACFNKRDLERRMWI